MTQAVNLANFANSLDSGGGVSPSALNAPVPVAKGGTNASTAAAARTSLDVPSTTGSGASGTWPINGFQSTNFTVQESGGKLIIKYGATTIFSIDSSGNVIAKANVTAYGTP